METLPATTIPKPITTLPLHFTTLFYVGYHVPCVSPMDA